jgi:hydrogenase-4 component E
MNAILGADMAIVLMTTLILLGSGRLVYCIRLVVVQGMAMSLLPLASPDNAWVFTLGTFAIKGVLLPWLLIRARRQADIYREDRPFIGFGSSLAVGVLLLAASFALGARLPLPTASVPPLVVPVAFFNLFAGLFLIIGRRTALTQVLGYLVMENGIYAFGMTFVSRQSILVELGALLDLAVGVFVMVLIIFHISRQFEHTDVDRLNHLRG